MFHLFNNVHACINKPASKNQDKKKEWWKKKTWRHNSLAEGQGWGVSSIYNKNSECSLKSPTLLKIEVAFVLKASSMCKCQSIPCGKLDLFSLQSFSLSPISFPKSFFFCGTLSIFWNAFLHPSKMKTFPATQMPAFLLKNLSCEFLPGHLVQDLIWP